MTSQARDDGAVSLPVLEPERPVTRADCEDGPRPCPWVSCRYHLLVDVNRVGSLRLAASAGGGIVSTQRRNTATIEEIAEAVANHDGPTCALDEAARGEHYLGEVGAKLGISGERVNQIVEEAAARLRRRIG